MKNSFVGVLLIAMFLIGACKRSEYTELVRSEMETGVMHDSIFFGLAFGQTKKEFFEQCWKLNKEEKVTNNNSNSMVSYIIPEKKELALNMMFYGIFNQDNIMTGMRLKFHSDQWALWNEATQSEQLIPDIKDYLMSLFPGNDFQQITVKNEKIWVKIDGNRRITIRPTDNTQFVDARIDDMRYVVESQNK